MAVRNADDILIGGGRVFIVEGTGENKEYYDLGYLKGEIKGNEQANSITVKESEGGDVLTLATNKEVHLTFSLLENNLDTILKLNPSASPIGGDNDQEADGKGYAVGTFQSDNTFQIEFWHKKRSGKYRCYRLFKAKLSGDFTALLINQDNENPISIDVIGLADSSRPTGKNIYEQFECAAAKAPNGGW